MEQGGSQSSNCRSFKKIAELWTFQDMPEGHPRGGSCAKRREGFVPRASRPPVRPGSSRPATAASRLSTVCAPGNYQIGTVAEPLHEAGWQLIDELNRGLAG